MAELTVADRRAAELADRLIADVAARLNWPDRDVLAGDQRGS
jgi:hypothetical protein